MKIYLILLIIIFQIKAYSQFGPQQIISNNTGGYAKVRTADIDNDGDLDIYLAGYLDISWFENTNGLGLFGSKQIITETDWEFANSVSASDLDGDGDLDILSSFSGEDPGVSKIAWNENLDGQGNFGPQQVISLDIISVFTIIGVDIDNDSDSDVLIIERNADRVAWYENLDGLGNFGSKITISTDLDWPIFGVVGDIDNDNDIDILSYGYDGDNVGWLENINGQGSFSGLQVITTEVDSPIQVFLADIDLDNDLDVVSTSLNDNKIAWYENIDGQGSFGPQLIISLDIVHPRTLFVQDLDNDGDNDIITSYWDNDNESSNGVVWLENINGTGVFEPPVLISEEVIFTSFVFASDIDNDNDIDVLSASNHDSKIAWYENYTILDNPNFKKSKGLLYPNPVSKMLYIDSDETIQTIKIFNKIGQLVKFNSNINKINTEDIQSGLYIVFVFYQNGQYEIQKLIKE